ncbi:GABA permease GabA [Moesziomyces antarcticus]|uniref:Related to HNM1 - choline permease n=2 Tax=Pseudozyma antarctica TaxID=84753 RepID=A0A5C3FQI9_PSEA2|nr:GABA permease GabA [Moesziomyces antarcticus]GAK65683.1 GABA permease GabA [Moesziomyces antarcticus]SPO46703.1 related to HNM1 - choline permease [Moesziomyces antarcticus]
MSQEKKMAESSKHLSSGAEITVSELDRQAPVSFVGDGGEEARLDHTTGDGVLGKKLSTLGAIALGYTSLSTWIAYSASAATALASGGANVLVWGMIIVGVCNMAAAITIAEPASQFPNASGQAAWVYRLHGRYLSYLTSWLVLLGYIFLSVAAQLITTVILLAMINLTFPSYVIETWHVSVSIVCTAAFSFVVAGIASKLVSRLNVFAFTWSVLGLVVVVLTLLIQSRGQYNTVEFALVDIVNVSGWGNNFIPWVLGLSQAALSTTAMDVPTHFSEEMANPARQVPIAIFGGLGTSVVVTLAYAFVLVFTLPELDAIITTSTGFPFAEMLRLKTSRSGAIVLLLIPLVSFLITSADVAMAASRCIYGFSRQRGFPLSTFFGTVNTRFDSPLRAGLLVLVCQSCIGLIYIGNTAAFSAIISVPTLLLAVSYAIVAGVCLAARYRAGRGEPRGATADKQGGSMGSDSSEGDGDGAWDPPFKMPKWLTISANLLTIAFTVLLCVFLSLPPTWPVTSANMNYTSAFLVGSFAIPAVCWIRYRHAYQGPLVH